MIEEQIIPKFIKSLNKRGIGILIEDNDKNNVIIDLTDNMVSREILFKGEWEPHLKNFFYKTVKQGSNFVCLGGHIGCHLPIISKLVGNSGKIHCFEPNPDTLKFLYMNVRVNNLQNIIIHEKAAFSENTDLDFVAYDKGQNTGHSHILPSNTSFVPNSHTYVVQAVKLDDYLKDLNQIDILHMDIEGAEAEAIYGAKELIKRSDNLLVIQEWSPVFVEKYSDIDNYLKFWIDKGFHFNKIERDSLQKLSSKDMIDIGEDIIDVLIAKDI
jgi:FkbM family methyltransferase